MEKGAVENAGQGAFGVPAPSTPLAARVRAMLFELADPDYRDFNAKLIPTLDPGRVIGVRMPKLRSLARQLAAEGQAEPYLDAQPHYYLEENHLHGLILNQERDFVAAVGKLEAFLPQVDNWATCDLLKPAAFSPRPDGLEQQAFVWMESSRTYTLRFGVSVLREFFLGEGFREAQLDAAAAVPEGDYYVEMAVAWYFAEALAQRWDQALPYLEQRRLPPRTHARAIRKACESFRIPAERKDHLRTLR